MSEIPGGDIWGFLTVLHGIDFFQYSAGGGGLEFINDEAGNRLRIEKGGFLGHPVAA